ncbi:hypothetical protein T09_3625 [Trichinella sp. T9]|nr:hypothetical protein T09_3625 [Trichinella sp. T9]
MVLYLKLQCSVSITVLSRERVNCILFAMVLLVIERSFTLLTRQIRYARLRSQRELHFITATTQRNEKLVSIQWYLVVEKNVIKSRENFRLLNVL